jgi:hypothetical protein
MGRLTGQVTLWDGRPPGTVKPVRIQSESAPVAVARALTDRAGAFEVELPAGLYRVDVAQRGFETRTNALVRVRAGEQARVQLTAPPVTGRVVPAGPPRMVSAGRGTRRGQWLGYGVAEGLPEATVRAILEDRRGALWLATAGGGVVRFDGARFEVYSEDSGLASNRIAALAEDGDGNLWLAADPGIAVRGLICLNPLSCRVPNYAASAFDPPAFARRTAPRMRHNSGLLMMSSHDYPIYSFQSHQAFGFQPPGAIRRTLRHETSGTGLLPRDHPRSSGAHGQLEPLAHADGA